MHNNFVQGNQHWFRQEHDIRNIQHACGKYMNYHVVGQMQDGSQVEGIIQDMDDQGVTMLVPEVVEEQDMSEGRIYGGYGGGYDGGYGDGYGGYPLRRYRRYRRYRYPYTTFVFPFFVPFPYYY
jgi:hypothetical protein